VPPTTRSGSETDCSNNPNYEIISTDYGISSSDSEIDNQCEQKPTLIQRQLWHNDAAQCAVQACANAAPSCVDANRATTMTVSG
jgi:hypothetical protein